MKIAIIGCGNMGLTYARSFLSYELVNKEDILLVEKNADHGKFLETLDIGKVTSNIDSKLRDYEIIILAVKPQDFETVAPALQKILQPSHLVFSIMAGISIERMEKSLKHKMIVRAMPNTPAQIGMGITAYVAGKSVKMEHIRKVEKMLSTTGREIMMEEESMLDAVTALSGSGPAYFYYFVKHMIEAGKQMGIDEGMSSLLVKQTMYGAYHLMNNANKNLDELIASVKSKGGTTEAALNVFEEKMVGENIIEALKAAEARAKELAK
ncbi:MAG: hypothetical protein RL060_183 [Bacteroidota bacterium]